METNRHQFGIDMATRFATAEGDEWVEVFRQLQRERKLSRTVRELNELLASREHGVLARTALQRIGLRY